MGRNASVRVPLKAMEHEYGARAVRQVSNCLKKHRLLDGINHDIAPDMVHK